MCIVKLCKFCSKNLCIHFKLCKNIYFDMSHFKIGFIFPDMYYLHNCANFAQCALCSCANFVLKPCAFTLKYARTSILICNTLKLVSYTQIYTTCTIVLSVHNRNLCKFDPEHMCNHFRLSTDLLLDISHFKMGSLEPDIWFLHNCAGTISLVLMNPF